MGNYGKGIFEASRSQNGGMEMAVGWLGDRMNRRGFLGTIGKGAVALTAVATGLFPLPGIGRSVRDALACYFCSGCTGNCGFCGGNPRYSTGCEGQYYPIGHPEDYANYSCGSGICCPEYGNPSACRACGITQETSFPCPCAVIQCEWLCSQL